MKQFGRVVMSRAYYRADGVRIQHDPTDPHLLARYGHGADKEGFDPAADTVGPGIYGGRVVRLADGTVQIGQQYQNHNPVPGPIYQGGGYADVIEALPFREKLAEMFASSPDPKALANEITTGGARPLHCCGMSRASQMATEFLIQQGADIDALDTYDMTPLQRMASNNLAVGAEALLRYGANPKGAWQMAASSEARSVLAVLAQYPAVQVSGSKKDSAVNGLYFCRGAQLIPDAFAAVCKENDWDTEDMWKQLNGDRKWWKHTKNDSYIYKHSDGTYWLDGPDGLARHIAAEFDAFEGVTVKKLTR